MSEQFRVGFWAYLGVLEPWESSTKAECEHELWYLGATALIAGVALRGFVFLATRSLTPFEALIVMGAFYIVRQWLRLNTKSLIGSLLVSFRYR